MVDLDELLTTKALAAELQQSHRSLERWRVEGTGPVYVQIQRNGPVRYRRRDVIEWLESRLMARTGEPLTIDAPAHDETNDSMQ